MHVGNHIGYSYQVTVTSNHIILKIVKPDGEGIFEVLSIKEFDKIDKVWLDNISSMILSIINKKRPNKEI